MPTKNGFTPPPNAFPESDSLLGNKNHDWDKPMGEGPWHIGFDSSYITLSGIQGPPYVFLRNNKMEHILFSKHK